MSGCTFNARRVQKVYVHSSKITAFHLTKSSMFVCLGLGHDGHKIITFSKRQITFKNNENDQTTKTCGEDVEECIKKTSRNN